MRPAVVMLADTSLPAQGYFWKFLMLSHYLNPLLAWKYQNAAVPQQEERRKVRKKKARKTRLGFWCEEPTRLYK